jgi:arylsulfatase A-like enzyme
VVFSTDHGDMMGEHRMLAKGVPYEGAVRVPLLMRVPGVAPQRAHAPTSQVDLVPTLLDALGVAPPAHLHGTSLLPGLSGDGATEMSRGGEAPPVVVEWNGRRSSGTPPAANGTSDEDGTEAASLRTIRLGRWKLTVDEDGEHELYDLDADPSETRNLLFGARLHQTPGAQAAVDVLWQRLQNWQRRTGDTLHLPTQATPERDATMRGSAR